LKDKLPPEKVPLSIPEAFYQNQQYQKKGSKNEVIKSTVWMMRDGTEPIHEVIPSASFSRDSLLSCDVFIIFCLK